MYWHRILETYENTQGICPIAHTMLTVHIGVLIDKTGKLLCIKDCSNLEELTPVPCTVKSETRTNNIAPHLLIDNYSYVGNAEKYKDRHDAYLKQLKEYVSNVDDAYATAVYNYIIKGTLENDLDKFNIKYLHNTNINFVVLGVDYDTQLWINYYLKQLPITGICYITGEFDYIPEAYPSKILSTSGHEKLFIKGCNVGYIASQKIIHTMQFLNYIDLQKDY